MRQDDKYDGPRLQEHLEPCDEARAQESHVVFDFTGMEQANLADLSLILTARLLSAPTDSVWVRSLPSRTAQVLRILRLDHLFRQYPDSPDQVN